LYAFGVFVMVPYMFVIGITTVFYVQAFIAIEKGFFELINESLAEKYSLMMEIPTVCHHFET